MDLNIYTNISPTILTTAKITHILNILCVFYHYHSHLFVFNGACKEGESKTQSIKKTQLEEIYTHINSISM